MPYQSTQAAKDQSSPGTNSRRRAYTLESACEQLGHIGRSTIYGLIAQGRLEAVKLGSRTLITDASISALLASLPRVKGKSRALRLGGAK